MIHLLIALLGASPAQPTLVVAERVPLVMVVLAPPGSASRFPSSLILDVASAALAPRTGLRLDSAERAGVSAAQLSACPPAERIGCWVRLARPAPRREAPAEPRDPPRYLLMIISKPAADGERMSALLVDLDHGVQTIDDAKAERGAGEDWKERAEAQIAQRTTQTPPVLVKSQDALAPFFEELVERALRPRLEANGDWMPFGSVRLSVNRAGATIDLDGKRIGSTRSGSLLLTELRPGDRTIAIDAAGAAIERRVTVRKGATAELEVRFPKEVSLAFPATRIGGVVLFAGGVALVAASLAGGSGGRSYLCGAHAGQSADCPGSLALEIGGQPGPTISRASEGTPGPRPLALGLGLGAAGIIAAVLPPWIDDSDGLPWRSLAIALGAGALAYALDAGLGGR